MKYLLFISSLLWSFSMLSQKQEWMDEDREMIEELINIPVDSTHLLESYFDNSYGLPNTHDLGFGWQLKEGNRSGGYISITSSFYYQNDSLVAFEIRGELPSEEKIVDTYKNWYGDYFEWTENNRAIPTFYGGRTLLKPLDAYQDTLDLSNFDNAILNLAIPDSRPMYYWSGGFLGNMSKDRVTFMKFAQSMSFDELLFLTYTKNPVLRFLSIEEMTRRNYIKTRCNNAQKKWIDRCFEEVPSIMTLSGCIGSKEDSRKLVKRFAKYEEKF